MVQHLPIGDDAPDARHHLVSAAQGRQVSLELVDNRDKHIPLRRRLPLFLRPQPAQRHDFHNIHGQAK